MKYLLCVLMGLGGVILTVNGAELSDAELARIGHKVWVNECAGTVAGLTSWNEGEAFASLGVGHFIWYPAGRPGPFEESFPLLVRYLGEHGVETPGWMSGACPWNTRGEFMAAQEGERMEALRKLLADTTAAQARFLAQRMHEEDAIKPFELNDTWLSELPRLTRRKDGPRQARDLLAERGIALVIERHLPGTYLDGAAMLSAFSQPVVALTLRYDRLDNFWFVLLHELAHVFLHLTQGLRFDFFDEEDGDKTDRIEQEADDFALSALIPEAAWEQCLSRFVLTEEAVMTDAENLGIDASIIAGRIRKERNDYTLLTRLVGQDAVRKQLEASDGN